MAQFKTISPELSITTVVRGDIFTSDENNIIDANIEDRNSEDENNDGDYDFTPPSDENDVINTNIDPSLSTSNTSQSIARTSSINHSRPHSLDSFLPWFKIKKAELWGAVV